MTGRHNHPLRSLSQNGRASITHDDRAAGSSCTSLQGSLTCWVNDKEEGSSIRNLSLRRDTLSVDTVDMAHDPGEVSLRSSKTQMIVISH